LTRSQLQDRRRESAQLIRRGKLSFSVIAQLLGVSRMAVSQWAAQLDAGGLRALRSRAVTGRPARLSPQDTIRKSLRSSCQPMRLNLIQGSIAKGMSKNESGTAHRSRWRKSKPWLIGASHGCGGDQTCCSASFVMLA
jgi:transposase